MDKLVSVVVPAYNVGLYIEECVKSVLNQTYTNWELIIVDDGSKDNTFDLAKKAAGSDARIRIHRQENQGVSVARNTGLNMSTGSSIIFLDGDDFWLPQCLEKLVTAKEQSGAQVAYCGYCRFYTNGYKRPYRYGYPEGKVLIPAVKGEMRCQIGTMLIDKNVIRENNLKFTEGCLVGQDLEFMLKVAAVATYKSVPQNLLMYRVRPNSAVTAKWNWEKHIHVLNGVRRASEFIIDRYKDSPDFNKIQAELNIRLGKMLSKFLWRIVKSNTYEKALELVEKILADPFYASVQKRFNHNCLGFSDRFKYRIVLSKNQLFWNLAKYM